MSDVQKIALVNAPDGLAERLSAVWRVPVVPVDGTDAARRFPPRCAVVYVDEAFAALADHRKKVPGCLVIAASATAELVTQVALCAGETTVVVDESDDIMLLAWQAWQSGARMASPGIDGRSLYRLYGSVLRAGGRIWCRALTSRELDVLQMMLSGATNAEIARDMIIQKSTVESHVRSILRKHGVADRVQLAAKYLSGAMHPDTTGPPNIHTALDAGQGV